MPPGHLVGWKRVRFATGPKQMKCCAALVPLDGARKAVHRSRDNEKGSTETAPEKSSRLDGDESEPSCQNHTAGSSWFCCPWRLIGQWLATLVHRVLRVPFTRLNLGEFSHFCCCHPHSSGD